MRQRLLREGVTSRSDYLDAKREFERTVGDLAATRARSRKAQEELTEARQRLTELDNKLRREALTERGKVTAQLAEVATWGVAWIVVLFGHGLNIGLCVIAIFAHGVRLNMLEFSNNVGVQWAGRKYQPFANRQEN